MEVLDSDGVVLPEDVAEGVERPEVISDESMCNASMQSAM